MTMPCVKRRAHGFVVFNDADVAHDLGPEARIDQVENGVFDAADVLIDRKPFGDQLRNRMGRCRLKHRSSDRNTMMNRRMCPLCRFRGGRVRHISDKRR